MLLQIYMHFLDTHSNVNHLNNDKAIKINNQILTFFCKLGPISKMLNFVDIFLANKAGSCTECGVHTPTLYR